MAFDYNPNTIWISYSSLSDFEKCPRLYYLRSIYRDKEFGNNFRIQVANPYLSLGEIVHDAIDNYVNRFSPADRNKDVMIQELSKGWNLKHGKIGGFKNDTQEKEFKKRSVTMANRFLSNKSFSKANAYKLPDFPKKKLFPASPARSDSESRRAKRGEPGKDLVLVGNFDWVETYENGLHIVDFKTGKQEEAEGSLQLPIYSILANENLDKPVLKTSYWYLDKDSEPKEVPMKNLDESLEIIQKKSLAVEKALKKGDFSKHSSKNCIFCKEYEAVLNGKAEHVGTHYKRKREVFFVS